MNTNYFQLLPCDVLDSVLRFLSKRPNVTNWYSHIDAIDLESLIELNGVLNSNLFGNFKTFTKTRSSLIGDNRKCLFDKALNEMRRYVTQVCIYSQSPQMKNGLTWISILENCSNLTSLTLTIRLDLRSFERILVSKGNALKSFSVRFFGTAGFVPIIARNTAVLETLEITDPSEPCTALWKSAGRTLRTLRVQIWRSSPDCGSIRDISEYCRGLRHIDISLPWFCTDYKDVAELYGMYKSQLCYANLGAMDHNLCRHVMERCPNAKYTISGVKNVVERMEVLTGQLRDLELEGSVNTDVDMIRMLSANCPNIERMRYFSFETIQVNYIGAILSSPKRSMISLDIRHGREISSTLLDAIAVSTGNLQDFSCAVSLATDASVSFRKLADNNPYLRSVEVFVKPTRYAVEHPLALRKSLLSKIFAGFEKSFLLQEIKIQSTMPMKLERDLGSLRINEVYIASRALRKRSVFVEVFGVHYGSEEMSLSKTEDFFSIY